MQSGEGRPSAAMQQAAVDDVQARRAQARQRLLARYRVLDTSPEGEFEEIVALAAQLCATPIATITFLDEQRQWFKARVGLPVSETTRDIAFCAHTVEQAAPLVVEDTHLDSRFRDNPLVTGPPGLRFYMGIPLVSAAGIAAGTLAVMDVVPRRLDALQQAALKVLAHQVASRLELRAALGELDQSRVALEGARDELEARVEARTRDLAEANLAQARAEAMYRQLWETTTDAGIVLDEDSIIRAANPGVQRILGHAPAALVGRNLAVLQPERLRAAHVLGMQRYLDSGERTLDWRATEVPALHADGSEVPVEIAFSEMDFQGMRLFVGLIRDVSERKQAQDRISWQASHDALTGLVNRAEFDRRLRVALSSAGERGQEHALLYLDLDQFKIVNDTCGHIAGDEMLRQLSTVLSSQLRASDTLARLGGDEFGVLAEGCPPEPATRLAEKLRRAVAEHPFTWDDHAFRTTVSIGQVNFGGDAFTVAEILSKADEACYFAKDSGRDRVHAYTPGDADLAERHGEMEWVERIRLAMEEDRLVLYAQPIHAVGSPGAAPVEVEVLLRMRARNGELVPPMAFLPAAERYNMMPAVDRWVVAAVIAHLARLGPAAPAVAHAVNLSAATLGDPAFPGFVRAQLQDAGVAPARLSFEITETAAICNLSAAIKLINDLRALGCRFALDDFGSGMSSFAYLKHLPVDTLKIDGSFVREIAGDPVARAMVASINEIGHLMGLRTIAEFVETPEILEQLRLMGVDSAQGFGLSRPGPLAGP